MTVVVLREVRDTSCLVFKGKGMGLAGDFISEAENTNVIINHIGFCHYEPEPRIQIRGSPPMYAIVKTGGKQYKVAEGDLVKVEKIEGEPGSTVALTPVLLVDGATVTTAADQLEKVSVNAELVEHTKGPKIKILKYKNKTGYKKRQGHRQKLTVLKITGIK